MTTLTAVVQETTLYQDLQAAGIECSNWQSDLYFPANSQTWEVLKKHPLQFKNAKRFKSNTDGTMMFDVPFGFDPFWSNK